MSDSSLVAGHSEQAGPEAGAPAFLSRFALFRGNLVGACAHAANQTFLNRLLTVDWLTCSGGQQRSLPRKITPQNQPLLSQIVHVIFPTVLRLTRQEQWVLCIVLSLLLVGWAVKAWRTAHPSTRSNTELNLK